MVCIMYGDEDLAVPLLTGLLDAKTWVVFECSDSLKRLRKILSALLKRIKENGEKFQENYIPEQNINIDDSLLLWKGILSFIQMLPFGTSSMWTSYATGGRRGRRRGRGQARGNNRKPQNPLLKEIIEPNKVYIGNINRNVTDELLKAHLCQFVPVVNVFIVRNRGNINSSAFGFAQLANEEETQKILSLSPANRILQGSVMNFKPARVHFKLPGSIGFQRLILSERDYDLEPEDSEKPCIHGLIDDVLLRIFESLPLKDLIKSERVCRRWQSLIHICFRKKACQEINKGNLNAWLEKNQVNPTYRSIAKVLILCGETMTELSVAEVTPNSEGKLLRVIAQLCPSLESLTLSSLAMIRNNFLLEFVNSCKKLKEFQIKDNNYFNEFNLNSVITRLPQLESLHLEGTDISGQCFERIPNSIKVLNLSHCNLIEPRFMKYICNGCPNLEILLLEGVCISSDLLVMLSKASPNLREMMVEIEGNSSNIEMSSFKNLKKLSFLGFSYSINKLITSLPLLEELSLDGFISETVNDFIDFSILTDLRNLLLPCNNKVFFASVTLKTISSCKKLEMLKFKGLNEHKPIVLEVIRKCHHLKVLDCPSITLASTDIEPFIEANKQRQHRLKIIIGLDQSALDQIEKLNDANYEIDMFDVHNLFSDFDVGVFNHIHDNLYDDFEDSLGDSDLSLDSDEINFVYDDMYDRYEYNYPDLFNAYGMLFDPTLSDDEFYN